MKKGLELLSLFVMTLLCLCGLSVMIYGGYQLYQEVTPQYSQELTEGSYRDAVVSQNVNLVFYRKNCPYCQAGKSAVIEAAKKVQHTTFISTWKLRTVRSWSSVTTFLSQLQWLSSVKARLSLIGTLKRPKTVVMWLI